MENIKQDLLAFFGNEKNRLFIYILFGFISLIVISSAVLLILSVPKTPKLSNAEETKVIDEIIKNNPSAILEETIKDSKDSNVPNESAPFGTPSQTPDLTKYNYRISEYSYKTGPAYKACNLNNGNFEGGQNSSLMNYFDGNYNYTFTEYFEKNRSINKSYVTSNTSGLFQINISDYSDIQSQSYQYNGGEYAIKAIYEPYEGYTQEEYLSYPASYANQYLDNSYYTFIGEEKIDGKDTYKIQTNYYTFCDGSYGLLSSDSENEIPNAVKIVNIIYADKNTYSILRYQSFLNEVSDSNLISTTNSSIKTSLVKLADVNGEFKFNYNVAVKIIDYTGYWDLFNEDNIKSIFKNYLATSNTSLLNDSSYVVSGISIPSAYPKLANSGFLTDRKFYPTSVEGDDFYLYMVTNNIINPESSINLYRRVNFESYDYINLDIYDVSVTKDDLIASLLQDKYTSFESSEEKLIIDSIEVPATKISFEYKYFEIPTSYTSSSSYPASYPSYQWTSDVYVFSFNNRVYKLTSSQDATSLNFKSYSSNNQTELNNFFDLIVGYNYYFPTSYASYPVSYNW